MNYNNNVLDNYYNDYEVWNLVGQAIDLELAGDETPDYKMPTRKIIENLKSKEAFDDVETSYVVEIYNNWTGEIYQSIAVGWKSETIADALGYAICKTYGDAESAWEVLCVN